MGKAGVNLRRLRLTAKRPIAIDGVFPFRLILIALCSTSMALTRDLIYSPKSQDFEMFPRLICVRAAATRPAPRRLAANG